VRLLDPGGLIASPAGARALMIAALPRLAGRRDRPSRALRRALAETATGRTPAPEREWGRRIEARREALLSDRRSTRASNLEFEGTMVASEAAWWLSLPPIWCRFLMRLVGELEPRSAIELGSGVGISGAYQAAAMRGGEGGRLITLDASQDWAALAREGFEELGLSASVELRLGDIAETLPAVLEEAAPVDYAFIDAEHTELGTISYFDTLAPHLAPGAVVVIDDVTYPQQSRRAWRAIRARPIVAKAVGLARVGVVIAREDGTAGA
jgi:predicted O-methyltransferase YrrM